MPENTSASLIFRGKGGRQSYKEVINLLIAELDQPAQLVQYSDAEYFCLRATWKNLEAGFELDPCRTRFDELAEKLEGSSELKPMPHQLAIGLFCSTKTHVADRVLSNIYSGVLSNLEVAFLASDNSASERLANRYGVPFFQLPKPDYNEKLIRKQRELLIRYQPDIVGLARYDRLIATQLAREISGKILSVENAFIPKLRSEMAVEKAHEIGLKLFSASAKITLNGENSVILTQASEELPPFPSLDDALAIQHRLEQKVFLSALQKLVEHKVLVYNARSIVFD